MMNVLFFESREADRKYFWKYDFNDNLLSLKGSEGWRELPIVSNQSIEDPKAYVRLRFGHQTSDRHGIFPPTPPTPIEYRVVVLASGADPWVGIPTKDWRHVLEWADDEAQLGNGRNVGIMVPVSEFKKLIGSSS